MSISIAIVAGWMLVFGLVLAIVSAVAYRRATSNRLLVVAGAFCLFFAKGLVLTLAAFSMEGDWFLLSAILDIVIITLLAFSVLKP